MKTSRNRQSPRTDGDNGGAVEKRSDSLPVTPWERPAFTPHEAVAMRAMFDGGANPDQQLTVVRWLLWAARHATVPIVPSGVGGAMGLSQDGIQVIIGQQLVAKWMIDLAKWRPSTPSGTTDEHGLGT